MDLSNLTGRSVAKAMLCNAGLGAATGFGYILVVGAGMLIVNVVMKKINGQDEKTEPKKEG